jgi:uncharacterized membrane protein
LAISVSLLYHLDCIYRAFVGTNPAAFAIVVVLLVVAIFVADIHHIGTINIAAATFDTGIKIGDRVHGPPISGLQL